MLTPEGVRVAQLTEEGNLVKGSENFLSIFKCIKKSYISGNEELLMYFIQTLHENKYLYPIVLSNEEEEYYPIRELCIDLLKLSLIDEKEELFLFIWNLIDKEEISSSLPLYILSKRRKLNRARISILEGISNKKEEWLFYAILTEDIDIISSFPLERKDLNLIYSLLEIYPSSRIDKLIDLTGCQRIQVEDIKIEYITTRPKFKQLKRMYTCSDTFPRELAEGNRCKLRLKFLSSNVTQKEMNTLSSYIDCYDISVEDLITSLCRFTFPELTTGKYIIPKDLPQLIGQPSDFMFRYL